MYQVKIVFVTSTRTEYYILNTSTLSVHSAWGCRKEAFKVANKLNNLV